MKFTKTKIKGVYVIEPEIKYDRRGYFFCVFSQKELSKIGVKFVPVNANHSFSKKKGTIRGLHLQKSPYQVIKLMQCVQGRMFSAVVDMRKSSDTYLQWVGVELSQKNRKMLLIPKGCAHGLQTLEEKTEAHYLVSNEYKKSYEEGVRWNDTAVNIAWPISSPTLSEKDKNWPNLV